MLVVYHIKIFSLAREKEEREVKICGVHFDRFRHFFTPYANEKASARCFCVAL